MKNNKPWVPSTSDKPIPISNKGNAVMIVKPWFVMLLLLAYAGVYLDSTSLKPFIEYDEEGMPILAEWRQEKLNQELVTLSGADQYALLAKEDGNFPCYSCSDREHIYLKRGEVWKYGITTKTEQDRYGKYLFELNLIYVIQYSGSIEECLKVERQKIYHYALLPENLNRSVPLIRPPGNKQDS